LRPLLIETLEICAGFALLTDSGGTAMLCPDSEAAYLAECGGHPVIWFRSVAEYIARTSRESPIK